MHLAAVMLSQQLLLHHVHNHLQHVCYSNIPIAVNWKRFGAAGFTGADLQNLMNEAAIFAARRDLKEISKEEIADALERIVAGPEKKGAVMSDHKKKLVAYHEVSCCSCAPA